MTADLRFADLVTIGLMIKPQGRHGEIVVAPLSDRPDRFPSLREAYVAGPDGGVRVVRVTSCWPHKGRLVLKLEGVDSIDEAEGYRGLELRIGEEQLAALPEGSYYHHQLKGLRVEDGAGRDLGRVADLLETGGGAMVLVVRGEAGELLVPLTTSFVTQVDLSAGRLRIAPPELIEVKQPAGARRAGTSARRAPARS